MASKPKPTMNRDFRDMLSELSAVGAKFMVIGGYAVVAHGIARVTKDIDIWVENTPNNADRVWEALRAFGAPMHTLNRPDLENPKLIFQIGVPPRRIDLLTGVAGVKFDQAYPNRVIKKIDDYEFPCISRDDLIKAKLAAGRLRDRSDAKRLQQQERNRDRSNR